MKNEAAGISRTRVVQSPMGASTAPPHLPGSRRPTLQAPKRTLPIKDALRAKSASEREPSPVPAFDTSAIESGKKPLESRRADFAALLSAASAKNSVPAAGIPLPPAIDSQFKFSASPTDSELIPLPAPLLLQQAASLLDRCLAIRSERGRLLAEKWALRVEIDRFLRLESLQINEREAGVDTVNYQTALLDSAAEAGLEAQHGAAARQLQLLLDDLLASGFNKRMTSRELTAWLSAYPLKDDALRGDDARYAFNGISRSKPDHLFDAARMENDQLAWEQANDLKARISAETAKSESGRLRKESRGLEAKRALSNIGFRRQRAQIERDAYLEKLDQAQAPGGHLNYDEPLARLEREFAELMRDAVARLTVAQRSLAAIYGFSAPLSAPGADYLDGLAAWTSNARNRLAAFEELDQNYTVSFSLKDLSKTTWESGKAQSSWTFDLPIESFPAQAHVRVIGLGLAIAGEPAPPASPTPQKGQTAPSPAPPKPSGFWTARIALPANATVRDLAGKATDIDQKDLPIFHLGMVADRDSREPEIARAGALRDASPIGKAWKVTLSPKSTGGTLTASLDDVQLYLRLAVRGLKAY